jgi:hypothetical protein
MNTYKMRRQIPFEIVRNFGLYQVCVTQIQIKNYQNLKARIGI